MKFHEDPLALGCAFPRVVGKMTIRGKMVGILAYGCGSLLVLESVGAGEILQAKSSRVYRACKARFGGERFVAELS